MVLQLTSGRISGRNLTAIAQPTRHITVAFSGGDRRQINVDDDAFLQDFCGNETLFVVDEALRHSDAVENLFRRFSGNDTEIIFLPGGEEQKDVRAVMALKERVLKRFGRPPDTVFAVGGGVLINAVNGLVPRLSLSEINDTVWKTRPSIDPALVQTRNLVVVPTTILAIADIAYGSKGNLDDGARKHAHRLFYDPTAIFLDPAFIQNLPADEIKNGLAECLKHALLQDCGHTAYAPSCAEIEGLFRDQKPDLLASFIVACQTMYAKAGVLGWDRKESGWKGILLSYGHLHAHAHEEASGYQIKHGDAVLFGMLVDLKLCGNEKLYQRILSLVPHSRLAQARGYLDIDRAHLRQAYDRESKGFFRTDNGDFKVLNLGCVGQFAFNSDNSSVVETRSWAEITAALDVVCKDIDDVSLTCRHRVGRMLERLHISAVRSLAR